VSVTAVEVVKVDGFAGALTDGAEADFAETTQLVSRRVKVLPLGEIDAQIAVASQQRVGREQVELAFEVVGGDGGAERSLLVAFPKRHELADGRGETTDATWLAGHTLRERVASMSQVLDGLLVAGETCHLVGADGRADEGSAGPVMLVGDLACQQRGAKPGVNESGELEDGAVAAWEMHGHDRRTRTADKPGDMRAPRGVGDATVFQLQVRDRTGGEDADAAA
jgi:hypothetical protein